MKKTCLLLLSGLMAVLFASAQQPAGKDFTTYIGMKGIRKKVSELRQARETVSLRREKNEKRIEALEEKEEKKRFRLDEIK